MTKTKSTKRALLSSVLALVLCFSMLVGSTFAWFTDTASTGINTIQSGNLDVVLEYLDGTEWKDAKGLTLNFQKAADAPEGEAVLWEPGCTYELPAIRVRNNGNLALKYQLIVNGVKGNAKLLEAIDWTVEVGDKDAVALDTLADFLTAKGTEKEASDAIVIIGHMKEEAGNEYQDLTITGLGITVVATQYTYESDSFNNQYDKLATADDEAELLEALAGDFDLIQLGADIALTAGIKIPAGKTVAIDLAGNTLSYVSTTGSADQAIENKGVLTIEDGVGTGKITYTATSASGAANPGYPSNTITNGGTLTVNAGTLENTTAGTAAYVVDNSSNTSNAVLNVNGGKLVHTQTAYSGPVRLCAINTAYKTTVNVNGGEIIGRRAIWVQLPSHDIANVKPAELNITGGKITSTDPSRDLAIYVFSYGDSFTGTKINITGGIIDGNIEFKDSAATGETGKDMLHDEAIGAFVLKNAELHGAVQNATKDSLLKLGDYASNVTYVVDSTAKFQAAIAAGASKINLNADIVMSEAVSPINVDFVLNGNGKTISFTNARAAASIALFDVTGGSITIKNVTFDGVNGPAILRTVGATATLDNVTVQNSGNLTAPSSQGMLRLLGDTNVTNCTFKNNNAVMVISCGFDTEEQIYEYNFSGNVFEKNTCNTTAVLYYANGAKCVIDNNKFISNTSNLTANGATVYLGFKVNTTVTNNLFENNKVITTGESKRVAGALMVGNTATIKGNAFIGNTVSGPNALGNDVCASVYYADIDLSGNYWGGGAPVENDDYFVEYDNNDVIINDYLTTYGN